MSRDKHLDPDFDLWQKPGFTPGVRQVGAMLASLAAASEDEAEIIERAVMRAFGSTPAPVARLVLEFLPPSERPVRGRLTRLIAAMAVRILARAEGDLQLIPLQETLFQTLSTLTVDVDLKTALNAVTALGQLPGPRTEDILMALWEAGETMRPEMRRALIRSLGKVGGVRAKKALDAHAEEQDKKRHLAQESAGVRGAGEREGERLLAQSRLILDRSLARMETSAVAANLELPPGRTVIFHGRRGLETFIQDELKDLLGIAPAKVTVTPGRVMWQVGEGRPVKSADQLQAVRCAERWALLVGGRAGDLAKGGRIDEALVETLRNPEWQEWLQSMTNGLVRYRIDWREATTGEMWALAERLKREVPALVNDPRESLWEIGVIPASASPRDKSRLIEIRAKGLKDERFAYRDGTVPASSHAPLAAALARLAGVRSDDVVWDPFCGAGTELIERARLGPYGALWGTDLDETALDIARSNMLRAPLASSDRAQTHLELADATQWTAARPTLTITNPPLGRRVARGQARELIQAVTAHIARILQPGGRLVWVSPFPEETRRILAAAGLKLTYTKMVDMGGFDAEMQRADKPKG